MSAPLVQTVLLDFMATLAPRSAAAQIFREGLQLTFGRDGQISVPTIIGDPSLAAFVRESWPIPVVQPHVEPLISLTPHKIACIIVLTAEMVRSSNVEALVTDALVRSASMALDAALLDANPGTEARPPGLRYDLPPVAADASPDPVAAMITDFTNLYLAVAPAAARPPIYVSSLARTAKAEISSPHGLKPLQVVGSIALRNTTDMVAVAPDVLVSVLGAVPEITASRENALHMDSSPADQPTRSTWQTDCVAVKVRFPVTWALRAPGGVAWLTATHW